MNGSLHINTDLAPFKIVLLLFYIPNNKNRGLSYIIEERWNDKSQYFCIDVWVGLLVFVRLFHNRKLGFLLF